MLTKDFSYILPDELIARYPAPERTASRLLFLDRGTGAINDNNFTAIKSLLRAGDLLVVNDSKVMPARLYGYKKTGGKIEILIERIVDEHRAWVQIRASKIPKPGSWIVLDDIGAQILEFDPQRGMFLIAFASSSTVLEILSQHGQMPLPPYMQREAEISDQERYQTVYAKPLGSVAAPTAGLHFSQELLDELKTNGVEIGRLTLHVGAGTFQPLRVAKIADHKMHAEQMQITQQLCDQVTDTKTRGGRVIAVGTTAVRALESAALFGDLQATTKDTDIFITPGFKFKIVDALLTNFHLPESTLLMLVCAFAGTDKIFKAYQHAIANKYRFYSYGDAMFIAGASNAF